MALLLFLYLLFETGQQLNTIVPHDLFFRLNPLAAISAMLASRSWMLPMALAGITLLLTLAVGRAWCGWLCPLGTVLDWVPSRRAGRNGADPAPRLRQLKDYLLAPIPVAA